ncbi:uncharacterized protein LOC129737458 isoform X4 [Falco cherrug]|uniref:uncharacterized protein LOC129737458 isoform X4 n=1 Tax=Falco cherrug TaxID=345164 RepID=UPI00247B2779|nr:uncharacterized protein LOC129737458 isoform X4 [Falco cherrug]
MCTRGILLFCFSVFRKSEPEAACGALTREHKLECLEDAFTSLQGMYHNRHEAQHESGDFLQRPGYWSDPRTENCLCFSRRIFGQRIQLSKRSFCFCCKESSIQQVYGEGSTQRSAFLPERGQYPRATKEFPGADCIYHHACDQAKCAKTRNVYVLVTGSKVAGK